ncbi:MAG: hypothetical protein ABL934_09020 [Lysobacteraceae bacterium]
MLKHAEWNPPRICLYQFRSPTAHKLPASPIGCCLGAPLSLVATSARSEHYATNHEQAFRSPGLATGETRDDGKELLNGKNGIRPETKLKAIIRRVGFMPTIAHADCREQ